MIKKHAPWLLFILVTIGLMGMIWGEPKKNAVSEIGYSDFIAQVDTGRVHDVTIMGSEIYGHYMDNRTFTTTVTGVGSLLPRLEAH